MGMFNILTADVACPQCGKTAEVRMQFKFGEKWLHEYRVGDQIRWGHRQDPDEGRPGLSKVAVDAIVDSEPACCGTEDFVVIVERDVITGVLPYTGQFDFSQQTWVLIDDES